ncbi:MAG: hypothetical protein JW763_08335 [candidate division Zixibacteria bacterium]|nr:hypothetical protein [candidate division Zixibacteria bacterium]
MLKSVELYTIPNDRDCEEILSFLREVDVNLNIRDLKKQPLTYHEISGLIRHLNLRHFINADAKVFKKSGLEDNNLSREDIFKLMAEDNDLLRKPIVVAGRLMTVGCNIDKIKEMLQIKSNGADPADEFMDSIPMRHNGDSEKRGRSSKSA